MHWIGLFCFPSLWVAWFLSPLRVGLWLTPPLACHTEGGGSVGVPLPGGQGLMTLLPWIMTTQWPSKNRTAHLPRNCFPLPPIWNVKLLSWFPSPLWNAWHPSLLIWNAKFPSPHMKYLIPSLSYESFDLPQPYNWLLNLMTIGHHHVCWECGSLSLPLSGNWRQISPSQRGQTSKKSSTIGVPGIPLSELSADPREHDSSPPLL